MRERKKVICALDDLKRRIRKKFGENFRNASRWDAARIAGPQADGKRKRALLSPSRGSNGLPLKSVFSSGNATCNDSMPSHTRLSDLT